MALLNQRVLAHLGAGVGNIVLATPLLQALHELGFAVDVWLTADYAQTIELLRPWNAVKRVFDDRTTQPCFSGYAHILPAIPPFYWRHFARYFTAQPNVVARPPPSLFYRDEQQFYLYFAQVFGYAATPPPRCLLPISPSGSLEVTAQTLVLAPGCKTGIMSSKRWPHFPELAEAFTDVAIVGTADDLWRHNGASFDFPSHVRSFVNRLSLRETAELLAGAGVVVANDSGLAHVAAAVGVPTVILFGPTPHQTLGPFPPNVTILRQRLPCEPCWFQAPLQACARRITCLEGLTVEAVLEAVESLGLFRAYRSGPVSNEC